MPPMQHRMRAALFLVCMLFSGEIYRQCLLRLAPIDSFTYTRASPSNVLLVVRFESPPPHHVTTCLNRHHSSQHVPPPPRLVWQTVVRPINGFDCLPRLPRLRLTPRGPPRPPCAPRSRSGTPSGRGPGSAAHVLVVLSPLTRPGQTTPLAAYGTSRPRLRHTPRNLTSRDPQSQTTGSLRHRSGHRHPLTTILRPIRSFPPLPHLILPSSASRRHWPPRLAPLRPSGPLSQLTLTRGALRRPGHPRSLPSRGSRPPSRATNTHSRRIFWTTTPTEAFSGRTPRLRSLTRPWTSTPSTVRRSRPLASSLSR